MIDIILCVFTLAILVLYIFHNDYVDLFISKIDFDKIFDALKEKKDK